MNTMTFLGIDTGKHRFNLHGQDAKGHRMFTSCSQMLSVSSPRTTKPLSALADRGFGI